MTTMMLLDSSCLSSFLFVSELSPLITVHYTAKTDSMCRAFLSSTFLGLLLFPRVIFH